MSSSSVEWSGAAEAGALSGLGQKLRQTRQARGLDQADLARQLNLDVRLIDALEREDLSALPGPVYVRGYLRNLAQALKMDEAELLRSYVQLVGAPQPAQLRHTPPAEPMKAPRGPRKGLPWLKMLFVLLVLAAAIYAARFLPESVLDGQFGLALRDDASTLPVSTLPIESSRVVLAPSIPLTIEPPPVVEQVPAPVVGEVVAVTPEPVTEPQPQEPVAQQPGLELRVSNGDSWVQVKDASGRVVFEELLKSGAVRQVEGGRPFQIVIGNRAAMILSLDGQAIDLTPYSRPNGKAFIAKLGG